MSEDVIAEVIAAWRTAHAAVDRLCSEFADLPGAAQQYNALCKLSRDFQEEVRREVEMGIGLARRLRS